MFVGGAGIEALKMGNSILAAALTMTLLILPIIIVSSQEAIRAVPNSVRKASYGLGANKWQTIRRVVLPAALPGILTDPFCLFQEHWEKQRHLCLSVYRLYYWQHLGVYWINFSITYPNIYLGENASRIPECCIGRHYRFTSYLNINEWRCDYFT